MAGLVGEQGPRFEVAQGGAVGAFVADVRGLHGSGMVEVEAVFKEAGVPREEQGPIQADVVRGGRNVAAELLMSGPGVLDIIHRLGD